jgi:mannose-6-phosphate isomerase-like protein (cupin superfamily)
MFYTVEMEHLENYDKEIRPWGEFERFTLNESTTVKIITVTTGQALSVQTHEHRDEYWKILTGSGTITLNDTHTAAQAGDTFWGARGTVHSVEAGPQGIQFLEIAFGHFDEDDITRLSDRYGRAPGTQS